MFIFDRSVWSFSMTKLKPWTDAMKNNLFLLPAPQKRNSEIFPHHKVEKVAQTLTIS